jgi:hypothetical protein
VSALIAEAVRLARDPDKSIRRPEVGAAHREWRLERNSLAGQSVPPPYFAEWVALKSEGDREITELARAWLPDGAWRQIEELLHRHETPCSTSPAAVMNGSAEGASRGQTTAFGSGELYRPSDQRGASVLGDAVTFAAFALIFGSPFRSPARSKNGWMFMSSPRCGHGCEPGFPPCRPDFGTLPTVWRAERELFLHFFPS